MREKAEVKLEEVFASAQIGQQGLYSVRREALRASYGQAGSAGQREQ